jgi:hypothetical protein
MGQLHVWKYIHIVAIHQGAVLSINRKTEFRTMLDKCTYTEYLASVMGPLGKQEYDPYRVNIGSNRNYELRLS